MEQYAGYDPGGNREIAFREVVEQNIQFGDNIEDQYDLEVLYRRYMGRIAPMIRAATSMMTRATALTVPIRKRIDRWL